MDRTEAPAAPAPSQSQSRPSTILLCLVAAAAVFRIATAIFDRPAPDGGLVSWQPRDRAAALSRASSKPILYDFTAAWCGPCKLLDADWREPSIAQTVNTAYVPARVVDRQREDGENPADIAQLQRRYEISGFPTLVAAAPDGRLLGKLEGYRGRAALLKFLKEPGAGEDAKGAKGE